MDSDLGRQRPQGHRAVTAPQVPSERMDNVIFRHAREPINLQETDLLVRPPSGAISPTRHSFDSDLRNYFTRSRRYSLPSESGDYAAASSLFDFARNRYGMTLIPISPPKEKEKLSITKLFGGSWQRKPTISVAMNPQHLQHVDFDSYTGRFIGLPREWEQSLTAGLSSGRWDALIDNSTSLSHSNPPPSFEDDAHVSDRAVDSNRLTVSSTTETFYSDISRYRRPAPRPPSFPSTAASTNEGIRRCRRNVTNRDPSHPRLSQAPSPIPVSLSDIPFDS